MNNWFTIHDAHPDPDRVLWHIYLQDKYKDLASEISVGDRVFFYETKNTKQIQFKGSRGKMGVVHVGYVIGDKYERQFEEALSIYNDGERKTWDIGIPTDAGQSNGFVSREKVLEILGYASNYYFKGFARGKGIKLIEDAKANELLSLFRNSSR